MQIALHGSSPSAHCALDSAELCRLSPRICLCTQLAEGCKSNTRRFAPLLLRLPHWLRAAANSSVYLPSRGACVCVCICVYARARLCVYGVVSLTGTLSHCRSQTNRPARSLLPMHTHTPPPPTPPSPPPPPPPLSVSESPAA